LTAADGREYLLGDEPRDRSDTLEPATATLEQGMTRFAEAPAPPP
jgi:hypothetical protein